MRPGQNERGSTLILAITLLAVLAAIGAAAVSLGSQERRNAAAKMHYDALIACASAAQMQIWSEAQAAGTPGAYLGGSALNVQVNMPDGTKIITPWHYKQAAGMTVSSVTWPIKSGVSGDQGMGQADMTNKIAPPMTAGAPSVAAARCIDTHGREYEVEISIVFPL